MRAFWSATLNLILIAAALLAADGATFAQSVDTGAIFSPPAYPTPPFVPAPDAMVNSLQRPRVQDATDPTGVPELAPPSSPEGPSILQQPSSIDLPSAAVSFTPLPPVSGHDQSEAIGTEISARRNGTDPWVSGVGFGIGGPCPDRGAVYTPATSSCLRRYEERIADYPHQDDPSPRGGRPEGLPAHFQPWWNAEIDVRLRGSAQPLTVNVDGLVLGALEYSPRLLAVEAEMESRQRQMVVADAEFDCRSFIESRYDSNSDPVGNLLTTGDSPRFRDHIWSGSAGYRRKTRHGGEWEVAQHLGFQDNNSRYFFPEQQGTTRLEISFTQPLLNGAGLAYNNSRIVLADIDANVAQDELYQYLLGHLLKVNAAYWDLYRARALYLQKQKLLESAASILELLEARAHVDAVQRQVLRARAAVASRRSEIARAEMSIRNAESKLRLLVNDPQLTAAAPVELIPRELPLSENLGISMSGSLQAALRNRPDISQAIREMRAASVRLKMAKKEMLPKLDLIVSTYVAGLEGESRIGSAFGNQFSEGEPGYSAGFVYEFPLGNRAAKTRSDRRQLEANKALFEFRATVEAGLTDVELAVREVDTSYREIGSTFQAMFAAAEEADYLDERWQRLPDLGPSRTRLLEDLLDAQERLAEEEARFVSAQVDYALALANLKRSTGILLRFMDDVPRQDGANQATSTVPAQPLIDSALRRLPATSG